MTQIPEKLRASDIAFGDKEFLAIARIAKAEFGLHLEVSKKALIQSRLTRRLRALGLDRFSQYCELLEKGTAKERDVFISALTTNVTHFYREPHHFEMLERDILPDLMARAKRGARIRIWSAGCSTGQEAYSIAGSLKNSLTQASNYDVRILATDIDPKVLSKAEAAVYRADECRFPTDGWRSRVFPSVDKRLPEQEVLVDLRSLVEFRRLNLVGQWSLSGKFDIIMCRNVAIYFDKPTQARLWSRFAEHLSPGGYLFIGHSERVHGAAEAQLESVGITVYRNRSSLVSTSKHHKVRGNDGT